MNMFHNIRIFAFALIVLSAFSCTKDEDNSKPLEAITTTLLADAENTGNFVYFSFEKNGTVPASEKNTKNWDFGLRLTTFLTNSGISGPGEGGVIVQSGVFDDIKEAPATGYKTDVAAGDLAIKDGEWYDYNPVTRSFAPKAGIVFLFRTGNGKFAKMELLKAEPTDDNGTVVVPPTRPTKIKYTLRYMYQPNGKREF